MSKYFIDTEFLEGTQIKRFLGIPYGKTKPTIDLISIGIVSDDGREYYAVSKDFNLKEAWNRWQPVEIDENGVVYQGKSYWIRDNVLKPIWKEFSHKEYIESSASKINIGKGTNYRSLKQLINKYGKTNRQIAEEIKDSCLNVQIYKSSDGKHIGAIDSYKGNPEFYGYGQDVCFAFINFMKNYGSI
jgi:hypothetical protein